MPKNKENKATVATEETIVATLIEEPTDQELQEALAYLKANPKAIKTLLVTKEKDTRYARLEADRVKFAPMREAVSREVSMVMESGWVGRIVFDFSENATSPEIGIKTRVQVEDNGKVSYKPIYNSTKTAKTRKGNGNGGKVKVIMSGHKLENQEFASTQALANALDLPAHTYGAYNALKSRKEYQKDTFWTYVGK